MNSGRTVLAQLLEFLPKHEFNKCIHRYQGHRRLRKFSCLVQFLCRAFAQLACGVPSHRSRFPVSVAKPQR